MVHRLFNHFATQTAMLTGCLESAEKMAGQSKTSSSTRSSGKGVQVFLKWQAPTEHEARTIRGSSATPCERRSAPYTEHRCEQHARPERPHENAPGTPPGGECRTSCGGAGWQSCPTSRTAFVVSRFCVVGSQARQEELQHFAKSSVKVTGHR